MSLENIDNKSAESLQWFWGVTTLTRVRARGEEIRQFILKNVQNNPTSVSKLAVDRFSISRQAVNAHLKRLVKEGALKEKGATKGRHYELAPLVEWEATYPIANGPGEDVVWRNDIAKLVGQLPENVLEIWSYGFTEMFNNARDHSGGSSILVAIRKTAVTTEMAISDNGIGIFRKIQAAHNLLDERHAIFELAKGKLTTDPEHHSGEGIFFTSRAFDGFDILSGGVYFGHEFDDDENWLIERQEARPGTTIFLKLGNHTARTLEKIFDQYSDEETYGFSTTVVPVKLAQYGNDRLISRSQAKRVLARVELFQKVILDFDKVPTIGQAFADEVFRVFAKEHPRVQLIPIHANSEVTRMITRAQALDLGTGVAVPPSDAS